MATIRTKFRSSSAEGREGALYYQVIHNRVVRQISTGYKLFASEWDQRSEAVIPCQHPAGMERDNYLLSVGERIRRDKIRLEKAIRTLSQSGPFTADDIVIRFHDSGQEPSFNDYIRQQIVRLKRLGKIRTSETYTAALKSFSSFMKGSDILFGELSSDLLMEYEAYLKNRGNSPNTISFYMRILKAVYNRAVENGLTGQRNLFKSVYTGVEKTLKRAIHLNDIRRIKRLDLSLKPHLDFARDMFLFCFYTRGMSFVDMAYLTEKNIMENRLIYHRRKTGKLINLPMQERALLVLKEYKDGNKPYLFPILSTLHKTEQQFAQFLGKSRLYQYLPSEQKKKLPPMLMTDTQIGLVARAYYQDDNFSLPDNGKEISMWNVYNLLTGANKSSYIDNFLDRAYHATRLSEGLNQALHGEGEYTWFIQ